MQKPVTSSTYAPGKLIDSGTITKSLVKSSAGNVYALRITNANAAVRYLQLHNKATTPTATDTAQVYFLIPAGTVTSPGILLLDTAFFAPSEFFTLGIGYAISTTATTFTDSATAADHTTHIRYF